MLWRRRSHYLRLGLDIGLFRLAAVELIRRGGREYMTRWAAVPRSRPHNAEALVADLDELLSKAGFGAESAVLSLDSPRVAVKTLLVPQLKRRDVSRALRWEAARLLLTSPRELVVDYLPASPLWPGAVLLAAANKEEVRKTVAAVEKCGLRVTAVETAPLALHRAALACLPESGTGDKATAVVEATTERSWLVVFHGCRCLFCHPLNHTSADTLGEDLLRALQYFQQHCPGLSLRELYMCGNAEYYPGVAAYVGDIVHTKKHTFILPAAAGESTAVATLPAKWSPAVATGAAFRGWVR